MQQLHKTIKSNSLLWAITLILALLYALTMQHHLHVNGDHQHDHDQQQHSDQNIHHQTHFANIHDIEADSGHQHNNVEATAIDITPDGLSKYFSKILLAIALLTMLTIILSRSPLSQYLKRLNSEVLFIRWHIAPPPQLRAPPL
ncbi:hypothetical protein MNBD_GAMMA17-245 [hydrothermal vent metagenome]|uniref:Uncharacterized protein n=1 Tax=hydrothermal vent metagenome TaxID=652676 RepID=A0A3B0Z981_9ZZZZ